MAVIELEMIIAAPIERVFDLSRSIDVHSHSVAQTREEAIAGRRSGLIELDETVTWRATHFGVRQTLTSKITALERPRYFQDVMVRGAFHHIRHDHRFESLADGRTRMTDRMDVASPFGPIGWLADRLIITRYMRKFLLLRNEVIRTVAESDEWKRFLA